MDSASRDNDAGSRHGSARERGDSVGRAGSIPRVTEGRPLRTEPTRRPVAELRNTRKLDFGERWDHTESVETIGGGRQRLANTGRL
jgi:hypothetical protein